MNRNARNPDRALIALNIGALALLAAVSFAPGISSAQSPARTRAHGQYGMLSGQFQGSSEDAIFLVDAANAEMLALKFDRSRRSLTGIGYRDMAADALLRQRQGR